MSEADSIPDGSWQVVEENIELLIDRPGMGKAEPRLLLRLECLGLAEGQANTGAKEKENAGWCQLVSIFSFR